MRLLGTRFQSTNFEDPDHVKALIMRKLGSSKSNKYGTKNTDVFKFEQLYNKLTHKRRTGATSKSDIVSTLFVLYKISDIVQDSNNSSGLFNTILET